MQKTGVKKRPKGRLEREVQAAVIAYLETRTDIWIWRQNVGSTFYDGAFVKFGIRGAPDLQGLMAPTGRFVGIECKREVGGELSEFQERWGENCRRHGGLYIVARSVDDVINGLGALQARVQKVGRARAIRR